jgi:phosphotransferase system HPr (HPr) family protein
MIKKEARVKSRYGIHARPAYAIYSEASKYLNTGIYLIDPEGNTEVDAKSILSILSMGMKCGEKLIVVTRGSQENEAAESVAKVINEFEIE